MVLCGIWEVIEKSHRGVKIKNQLNDKELMISYAQYKKVLNKELEVSTIISNRINKSKTKGVIAMNKAQERRLKDGK